MMAYIILSQFTGIPQNTCFVNIKPVDNVNKSVNNLSWRVSAVDKLLSRVYRFSVLCLSEHRTLLNTSYNHMLESTFVHGSQDDLTFLCIPVLLFLPSHYIKNLINFNQKHSLSTDKLHLSTKNTVFSTKQKPCAQNTVLYTMPN